LDALRARTITAGEETPSSIELDDLVTNQDINAALNTSLTMRTVDLAVAADGPTMSDETYIDIVAGQLEYELPEDLCFLRTLYYKSPTQQFSLMPPLVPPSYAYDPMTEVDEERAPATDINSVPTYKRRLGMVVLNYAPQSDNANGLRVEYVKWLNPLLDDDAVIETQFVRILQEVVILDAAVELTVTKLKLDPGALVMMRGQIEERFIMAVRSAHTSNRTQIEVTPTLIPYRRFARWSSTHWRR
jgi:hypothetical protein